MCFPTARGMSLYNQPICHSGQHGDIGIHLVPLSLWLAEKKGSERLSGERGRSAERMNAACSGKSSICSRTECICHREDSFILALIFSP